MKRLVLVLTLALTGCTDPSSAQKALDDMGFKEINVTGYRWFSCGEDYLFHTGYQAKNPNGKQVTGTVCSGLFKGSSVKFD